VVGLGSIQPLRLPGRIDGSTSACFGGSSALRVTDHEPAIDPGLNAQRARVSGVVIDKPKPRSPTVPGQELPRQLDAGTRVCTSMHVP
jgi:hypothetical protein